MSGHCIAVFQSILKQNTLQTLVTDPRTQQSKPLAHYSKACGNEAAQSKICRRKPSDLKATGWRFCAGGYL